MGFTYKQNRLHCEDVDLQTVAKQYGTPAYIYSEKVLRRNADLIKSCFIDRGFEVSYAMKANPNPQILKLLKTYGFGVDIVSAGEFQMARLAGFEGSEINFAGVGKTMTELKLALEFEIDHFNVESLFELDLLESQAALMGVKANVLLRLNPDIDPQTHPHISTGLKQNKFGMGPELVSHILTHALDYPHINFDGLHCHIGSQIINPQPFLDLIDYLQRYTNELAQVGVKLSHLDLGGGFGVSYENPFEDILETTPYLETFAESAKAKLSQYKLHIQPGRVLVANSAVLLSQVLGIKENGDHYFVVIDGATTELIRPALYNAYHHISPYEFRENTRVGDVVGPVCESSDALAKNRNLPEFNTDDLLTVASAGAYASSMGSTYNLRPRSPEILVCLDGSTRLIRRRETFEEMTTLYQI
ncbi:MAG: diaminopimelate decarboxylase [Candidatus Marinimicrobia bacterium]|nr:diaminopimelate decarboxylase [Candidatus Neomarinimicrobiota bacterium]